MFTDLTLLQANQGQLLGVDFFDPDAFLALVIRFSFNFLVIAIIVRGLYYSVARRKNYLFAFMLISTIVFLICFLLDSISLGIGFALGLFAIFGIIRYRTNPIPIKEMTYLFIVIGISVINGLSNMKISYLELVFTNVITIIVVYFLERIWLMRNEAKKIIDYENIELIQPGRRAELIKDLKERTNLDITKIEIGRINYLRDSVRLRIHYRDDASEDDGIEVQSYDDDSAD
ncbi:DUF4956 domain-containing protein [Bacteroidota bacterium]